MKLFAHLLNETADADHFSLSSCLLKAKVLASKLKSPKFRKWVDSELGGYNDSKEVPDYRVVRPSLIGDFSGPFGSAMKNVVLTTDTLSPKVRDVVENHRLTDNVGELEALVDTDSKTLCHRWDLNLVQVLRHTGVRVDGMVLQDVRSLYSTSCIEGALHSIRARLLDFLIELGEQYPDLEEAESETVNIPAGAADRIVEQKIYHNCKFTEDRSVNKNTVKVGGDQNVGGDFVIADRIRDSFNNVSGSAPAEVKNLLRQLADALAEGGKELPPDVAKQAAEDFDTLAKEAAKKEPRRSFLKAAGDTLVGTVKVAGNLAGPVAAIVAAIMKAHGT